MTISAISSIPLAGATEQVFNAQKDISALLSNLKEEFLNIEQAVRELERDVNGDLKTKPQYLADLRDLSLYFQRIQRFQAEVDGVVSSEFLNTSHLSDCSEMIILFERLNDEARSLLDLIERKMNVSRRLVFTPE